MNKYQREIDSLLVLIDGDLLAILEENGCIIAGGALTSIFTNKPVNDIDVYFRSKEAWSDVVRRIFNYEYDDEIHIGHNEARVTSYTNKSITLVSADQKVQLIGYKFFDNPLDILADYDFTINMAAYDLKTQEFVCDDDLPP